MTHAEFATCMGIIGKAIGKPLEPDRQEVYFDLLGDLLCEIMKAAAARVCLQHRWATFPLPAELREAAAALTAPETEITPAEAWDMAWSAAARIDLGVKGRHRVKINGEWRDFESQADSVLSQLPPIVAHAMQAFSIPALCHGEEPTGVVRGQFLKMFEQIAARGKREALLPAELRPQIDRQAERSPQVAGLLQGIGKGIGPGRR